MKRAGELEELDGPLLLLASDAGSFMTGSVITVDGGHLLGDGLMHLSPLRSRMRWIPGRAPV